MECSLPLDKILRPILDLTEVWFIPGNHDADSSRYWDNLIYSGLADRKLHRRVVVEIDGMRVAGLEGVFEEPVWLPSYSTIGPQNYLEMVDQLRLRREPADIFYSKCQRYRATISPNDYYHLAMDKADILVTHQAPVSIDTEFQRSMNSWHSWGLPTSSMATTMKTYNTPTA